MTPEEQIAAVVPAAAAVVCAVADQDEAQVAEAIEAFGVQQLRALVVLLASVVPDTTVFGPPPLTQAKQVDAAVGLAASIWGVTPGAILSRERGARPVLDARAVAMAALRYVGHTTVSIGAAFGRDHSSVSHAASRVGENATLRRRALHIADQIGERGHLGDELQVVA